MRCVQTIDTKENLCGYCNNRFATCKPYKIKFGNGIGKDNVILCSEYTPNRPTKRLPKTIMGSTEFAKRYDYNNPNAEKDWSKNRVILSDRSGNSVLLQRL